MCRPLGNCPVAPPLNPALVMTTLQCVIILLYRVRHRVFNHVGLGPTMSPALLCIKNVHSRRSINGHHHHRSLRPLYRSTCVSRHLQLKTGGILSVQSFTARMPLLTATSVFGIGLGRRRWSSPQQCYLHCLHTLLYAYVIIVNNKSIKPLKYHKSSHFKAKKIDGAGPLPKPRPPWGWRHPSPYLTRPLNAFGA